MLKCIFFIYRCLCLCACVCDVVHVCGACTHMLCVVVQAKGWQWISSFVTLHINCLFIYLFLRETLSLKSKLIYLARLTGQWGLCLSVAQKIKAQRQIFGFNLKTRKANSQATRELLPLRNPQIDKEWVPVSSLHIFLSSGGLKTWDSLVLVLKVWTNTTRSVSELILYSPWWPWTHNDPFALSLKSWD